MDIDLHVFVEGLTTAMEAKDTYTYGHSDRVACLAYYIGKQLGLSDCLCDKLHIAGHLHDIGKLSLPDSILYKKGKLTDEEYKTIKEHATIGYNILNKDTSIYKLAKIVKHHHERIDGEGYPDGLKGEEIPLGSRIIALADSFDAMVTERSYKASMSIEEAAEEIRKCTGSQFDQTVVNAFFDILHHGTIIEDMFINKKEFDIQLSADKC